MTEPKELISSVMVVVFSLLGVVFLWWGFSIWRLRYSFSNDNLNIRWGAKTIMIPISEIREIVSGFEVGKVSIGGLNWWGCHVGNGVSEHLGPTDFFSTHNSVTENVFIVTNTRSYSLTVGDIDTFYQDYLSRYRASTLGTDFQEKSDSTFETNFPIWQDTDFQWLLGLAAVPFLGILVYTYAFFDQLPSAVRVFFPEAQSIVEIVPREELLKIVYVAFGIFFCNIVLALFFHFRSRAASIWLILAAGVLNSLLLVALIVSFQSG